MKIQPERLSQSLSKELLPVYVICGEEPLLQQEAADALRAHCREAGFGDREILDVDAKFDWGRLLSAGNALSLFAERQLIELRLEKKPDKQGGQAILDYLDNPNPDNVLLISCPKPDKRAKWLQAADSKGAVVQAWKIDRRDLPRWLSQRLQLAGLRADQRAVQILADRVEGNLFAAAQEIEKLRILADDSGNIDAQLVAQSVASSARYDIFKLIDAAMQGQARQALTMLFGLKGEGVEVLPCIGAIGGYVRKLYHAAWQLDRGGQINRVVDQSGLWDKQKIGFRAALERNNLQGFERLLRQLDDIDQAVKGRRKDDPWVLLADLVETVACGPLKT